uniref:Uncharacterized protein n=1 Tax=Columba livia TaxID=8932 RepID=R7VS60_COLLI
MTTQLVSTGSPASVLSSYFKFPPHFSPSRSPIPPTSHRKTPHGNMRQNPEGKQREVDVTTTMALFWKLCKMPDDTPRRSFSLCCTLQYHAPALKTEGDTELRA